jgi:DNA-binding response OmpR family regulator
MRERLVKLWPEGPDRGDDNNIAELLHLYLEKEGFETQVAPDGGKGVELYRSFPPELVLLDIMLPVMDGWSVLKKIRETDKTPVILLTAKGETNDKVQGLEGGADDYIVKPFEMKEVLARIHAVLRRYGAENGESEKKLSFDKLVINLDSYELVVDGRRIDPPPQELELLSHLAASPNGCSPAISSWTRCGASTTLATPARWTCTSSGCGRSWRVSPTSGP